MASLNLAHRWYLGYALDEDLPDHSSLTRIRQRLGVDVFQRFFETVVDLCQESGLVWGRELYVDATRVRADADTDSLVPRFYADARAHVADIFNHPEPQEQSVAPPANGLLHLRLETRETDGALHEPGAARWNLLDERRLAPGRPSHRGYRRTSDIWVSTTDPDATPMWTAGKARVGYHDHYVVDGGKRWIILAALVTPADVMENQPMLDLLWRVREKMRGYHATEAYKKAMRKRQVWAEPLFAEAKLWHGLRRFRRRGLENANMEGVLIAAGQNLKRFLAATGWGRNHGPCGSLLALPREPNRLAAVSG